MLEKTLNSLWELKAALSSDRRFQRLEALEDKINLDENVKEASKAMKEAEAKYEDSLSIYGEHSSEAIRCQKNLYKTKLRLDSLPLVQEYNEAYIQVRDLEMKLDDFLFSSFKDKGERKC